MAHVLGFSGFLPPFAAILPLAEMRRKLGICLVLAAITLAAYWPLREATFVYWDDPQYVAENPHVKEGLSWQNARWAFTSRLLGNWHPVTMLSHMLDCQLFGVSPGPHHLVNVGFHIANAILLFVALSKMTRSTWRSALVASLFALHPLRVESVAWISERKDVLSGFFFMLTLLAYAGYVSRVEGRGSRNPDTADRQTAILPRLVADRQVGEGRGEGNLADPGPTKTATLLYALTLLLFALGLMSKSMLVTLPFVLLLLDFWPFERFKVSASQRFNVLTFQRFNDPKSQPSNPSPIRLLRRRAKITVISMVQGFWPLTRRERGAYPSGSVTSEQRSQRPKQPARLVTVIFARRLWEKTPFLLLAAAFCVVALVTQASDAAVASIRAISVGVRVENAILSYLRYLAKMAWPTDLAAIYPHPVTHPAVTEQWPEWQIPLIALLLVAVSTLCIRLARRRPYLAVGWFWYLGTMLPVIGLVQVGEQAMADRYTYIPLIGPTVALVWLAADLLGRLAPFRAAWRPPGTQGRKPACVLVALLAAMPVVACALLSHRQAQYWHDTATLFAHTVAVTPDNASAEFSWGVGLEKQGLLSQAMVHYRAAQAIDPRDTQVHYNMGQVLRKQGYLPEAAVQYQTSLRLNPADLPSCLNLAGVLQRMNRFPEAVAQFEEALRLDPDSIEALNNLAWLLATSPQPQLRNGTRALQLAQRACDLSHFEQPVMIGTLAAAYAETGRFADAVAAAEKASALATRLGNAALATRNQQLLELYRNHHPYHESP